ncbi:formate--tetrahydrofolate ligase [Ligilactobacillus salitolerans]|uniref:Formate--tetrahydrofolate ligase n=1 Tax=Ligilactobacillus salitolerans TaxID=1808352 RepID=A0A401IW76_9LACO|nr:formate--tetrahydrofolate ligase [Ligilactobacillus salitolerans]GBG95811.1 formate--tetrahydrofolate ligase [Ligilactobacillus salitolerans]
MKDIEIAQKSEMLPITQIAQKVGIKAEAIEPYGNYKAKITQTSKTADSQGKLILVTAVSPTPAGEGKSTVTIGLADALSAAGKKTMIALREPSLGPVMGAKGGATGGGYSQVLPMEDINLHFTGDMHALTTANNTLAALIDNHLQQGNELGLDPRQIVWKRVLDINDRALRHIVIGMGGKSSGVVRQDGFDITVASELMAILCLAKDLADLKARIAKILVGYTYDGQPVTVSQLGVEGAITTLLKDALKPNLVQTLEHTPTLIHGGPFANIAHGCNSVLATKTALNLADYTVTEAGFGSDLGAEKFLDIKTPVLGKTPDTIVIVATVRALKMNGGVVKTDLEQEDLPALQAGFSNLKRHIQAMSQYGVPVVVAINQFATDSQNELERLQEMCQAVGVPVEVSNAWALGSQGASKLAETVLSSCQQASSFKPLYAQNSSLEEKILTVVSKIYQAKNVVYSKKALQQLQEFKERGWDQLPVCMAKTQYSFSDDPKLLGAPKDFEIHVREFVPKLGAGFIVALTGNVLTMPGLPKKPAANGIDIDENGKITGLF